MHACTHLHGKGHTNSSISMIFMMNRLRSKIVGWVANIKNLTFGIASTNLLNYSKLVIDREKAALRRLVNWDSKMLKRIIFMSFYHNFFFKYKWFCQHLNYLSDKRKKNLVSLWVTYPSFISSFCFNMEWSV